MMRRPTTISLMFSRPKQQLTSMLAMIPGMAPQGTAVPPATSTTDTWSCHFATHAFRSQFMTKFSIHTDVRCFSSTSSAGGNPKPSNSTDDPGTENDTATPESSSTGTEEGPSLKEQEMEAEIKKLKDHLLRSYAEQENTRTIAKRDVAEARQFAIKSFAKSLLDVSDNLQRALDSVSSQDVETIPQLKTIYEGIQMTNTGLLKAFSSNGIKKYCEVPGDKFDPSLHSALMQYPDPNREPDTVGQVITVGFTLNDRVLRPAEVGVVKNP